MSLELFIFLLSILLLAYFLIGDQRGKLPPGPIGFPILGHLPLLGRNPHITLLEWKKKYGPIIFMNFGSFPSVILQDAKIIKEAFSLQAFCGRSQIKPLIEGCDKKGIFFTEGPRNTEQRQFVIKNLKNLGVGRKTIEEKILQEISELMESLKDKAGQNVKVNHLFSASVISSLWSIVIGERFAPNDPKMHEFCYLMTVRLSRSDTFLGKMAMFLPIIGTCMSDLSGFNDKVSGFREIYNYMQDRIEQRKTSWIFGQPRDLTDVYLDKVAETTDTLSSFHAKHGFQPKTTGDIFMAATETTSSTLEWFMYYMAKHQQIQEKFYKEIHEVIGLSRIPSLTDRSQMPYTEALIAELLRITAIVPLALFHRTLEDVEFHGYKIPKGTTVIPNIYACHHDPDVWGDPDQYRPERFLTSDGKLTKTDGICSFGLGKRSCIGEGLARDEIFLFTTCFIQKYKVSFPPGASEEVGAFNGIVTSPVPFNVQLTDRVN